LAKNARFLGLDNQHHGGNGRSPRHPRRRGSGRHTHAGNPSLARPAGHRIGHPDSHARRALQQFEEKRLEFRRAGRPLRLRASHDMVLLGAGGEVLIPFNHLAVPCRDGRSRATPQARSRADRGPHRAAFHPSEAEMGTQPRACAGGQNPERHDHGRLIWPSSLPAPRAERSDRSSNGLLNQKTKSWPSPPSRWRGSIRAGSRTRSLAARPWGRWPLGRRLPPGARWPKCSRVGPCGPDWATITPGGVGSGLADRETLVLSLGSSGTVIRRCRPDAQLRGNAARFEYFEDSLLLEMLADCAGLVRPLRSAPTTPRA